MDLSNGIALIQSKTFWGALLALLAVVAQQFGLPGLLKWAADPNTLSTVLNVVTMAGTIIAIFGRTVATKPVTGVITASPAN